MATQSMANGLTAKAAHDAMIEEITKLFKGATFTCPTERGENTQRELNVYGQMMPIQTVNDEYADTIESLAPAVQVRLDSGSAEAANRQQQVVIAIVICTYDNGTEREGITEVYEIIQKIMQRFMQDPLFGKAFEAQYPFDWAIQQEETPPYYYGAVTVRCALPAVTRAPLQKNWEEYL